MSQRTKVVGARTPVIWLLIAISLIVIAALAVGGLVIYPQFQTQQSLEQHYKAGLAFQNVGDVDKAVQEYEKIILLDANYKDVQSRLAEVRVRLAGSAATATAVAMSQAGQTQATVQAMATAAQATVVAGPTATAEALEVHYQKGLGYMNMRRWADAKTEFEQVFSVNPTYQDVQAKLTEVENQIARLVPTATPTPITTPTPHPVVIADSRRFPLAGRGGGGNEFVDQSSNVSCLVGLSTRYGTYIDWIQPIYRQILSDGSLGAQGLGQGHGGSGGKIFTVQAPSGWVVIGINMRAGKYVDQLGLVYGQLVYDPASGKFTVGETRYSEALGGTGGVDATQLADPGYCVIGLHGRSATYLDNLGIIVGRLSTTN